MESDLLEKLREFPSPFFWNLDESMLDIVHEKLIRWKSSEADRLACKNAAAFLSYARDKDSLQAHRQFQEVLEEDPENLVALTSLAYIEVKHGNVEQAETKLMTLVTLTYQSQGEKDVLRRLAFAMFEKAFCLARFGQTHHMEALGCVEKALKFDSGNVEWLKTETFLLTKQVENKARVRNGKINTFLNRAADNALKLQQIEPDNGQVLFMSAELFEAAESAKEGQSWKRSYKHLNPDRIVDPSVLYEMAYELCPTDQIVCRKVVLHLKAAHKWQKFEKILKKAIKDFPNDQLLYHQLGLRYFTPFQDALLKEKKAYGKAKKAAIAQVKRKSAFIPEAQEYFRKGLEIEPCFTRCRIGLAWCLYYQGNVQESWQQLCKAAEMAKDKRERDEARREWARLLAVEGNESEMLMQLCEAPRSLEPTVLFDKACSPVDQIICRRAVLHFKAAREWQKMEEILTTALKQFPNDHVLYHQYGQRYLVPFELARAEAKEAKGMAKEVAEANTKDKSTFLPKARKYFQKGLKIDPLFTRCRVCLARCLYYQSNVQESWQQFHTATTNARDDSNVVEARRDWANLLIEDGNEPGALIQLCEALRLKDRGVKDVYRRLDFALDSWCKVDKHDPRPVRVRAAFALESGREDKAIRYYKYALQNDGNDTSSLVGLGKAYSKKGKGHFGEAKKCLEKASRLGSSEAVHELTTLQRELLKAKDQNGAKGHFPQTVGHKTAASPLTFEDDKSDTEDESLQGATGYSAPQPNPWDS